MSTCECGLLLDSDTYCRWCALAMAPALSL